MFAYENSSWKECKKIRASRMDNEQGRSWAEQTRFIDLGCVCLPKAYVTCWPTQVLPNSSRDTNRRGTVLLCSWRLFELRASGEAQRWDDCPAIKKRLIVSTLVSFRNPFLYRTQKKFPVIHPSVRASLDFRIDFDALPYFSHFKFEENKQFQPTSSQAKCRAVLPYLSAMLMLAFAVVAR